MSSSDEFDISELINGGFKRKKRNKQSKEDAIYGVFADSSFDKEYFSVYDNKKSRNLASGIKFKSAGKLDPNENSKQEIINKNDEKKQIFSINKQSFVKFTSSTTRSVRDIDGTQVELAPSRGKRVHSPLPSTFGFSKNFEPDDIENEIESENKIHENEVELAEESSLNKNSDFKQQMDEKSLRKDLPQEFGASKDSDADTFNSTTNKKASNDFLKPQDIHPEFAKFERHTRGIGMKMLKKWGFQGRLGKNETGRINPIIAKMRPKRAGLNYEGADEANMAENKDTNFNMKLASDRRKLKEEVRKQRREQSEATQRKFDSENEEDIEIQAGETQSQNSSLKSRRKRGKKDKKNSTVYITADELIRQRLSGSAISAVSNENLNLNLDNRTVFNDTIVDFTRSEYGSDGRRLKFEDALSKNKHLINANIAEIEEDEQEEVVLLPELRHNISKLVRDAEIEIIDLNREIEAIQDQINGKKRAIDQQKRGFERHRQYIKRYEKIKEVLDEMQNKSLLILKDKEDLSIKPGNLFLQTLDEILDMLEQFQHKFSEEYASINGLSESIAFDIVFPIFNIQLKGDHNQLSNNPSNIFDFCNIDKDFSDTEFRFSRLKSLLSSSNISIKNRCSEFETSINFKFHNDLYNYYISTKVVPLIQTVLTGTNWNFKLMSSKCVSMLESCAVQLPTYAVQRLLSTIILPRLKHEIEAWQPMKDKIPVHSQVLPWINLLKQNIQPICDTVFRKLDSILSLWSVKDRSAYAMLKPQSDISLLNSHRNFENTLEEDSEKNNSAILRHIRNKLRSTLKQKILPKLYEGMDKEILIDCEQQNQIFIDSVFLQADMFDKSYFIVLLERKFQKKWHFVLYQQLLSTTKLNLIEKQKMSQNICEWYFLQKKHFSERLFKHKRFVEQLFSALDMINSVLLHNLELPSFGKIMCLIQKRIDKIPLVTDSTSQIYKEEANDQTETISKFSNIKVAKDNFLYFGKMASEKSSENSKPQSNFREFVEWFAQRHNIDFCPNTTLGRYEGKQIYRFGSSNIYLDKNLVFVRKDEKLQLPTSMEELLAQSSS